MLVLMLVSILSFGFGVVWGVDVYLMFVVGSMLIVIVASFRGFDFVFVFDLYDDFDVGFDADSSFDIGF